MTLHYVCTYYYCYQIHKTKCKTNKILISYFILLYHLSGLSLECNFEKKISAFTWIVRGWNIIPIQALGEHSASIGFTKIESFYTELMNEFQFHRLTVVNIHYKWWKVTICACFGNLKCLNTFFSCSFSGRYSSKWEYSNSH